MQASRRTDLQLLSGMLSLAVAVWSFVFIAGLVERGATQAFDDAVVRAFRDPDDPTSIVGGPVVAELARDVTSLGSLPVLAIVALSVAGFLLLEKLHRSFALVAAASFGGTAWTFLLKEIFARPRPHLVVEAEVSTTSFPSGHSALSAVIYLTLAAMLARLLERRALRGYVVAVAALITIATGISRVALGVHYPSDVLAGWVLGLAWALFCWTGMAILQRRGAVETVREAHEVAAQLAHRDPAPDAKDGDHAPAD